LLSPNFQEFKQVHEHESKGMTSIDVSHEELATVNRDLAGRILTELSGNEGKFLLSVKTGSPDFGLLSISDIETFPAIRWNEA